MVLALVYWQEKILIDAEYDDDVFEGSKLDLVANLRQVSSFRSGHASRRSTIARRR